MCSLHSDWSAGLTFFLWFSLYYSTMSTFEDRPSKTVVVYFVKRYIVETEKTNKIENSRKEEVFGKCQSHQLFIKMAELALWCHQSIS